MSSAETCLLLVTIKDVLEWQEDPQLSADVAVASNCTNNTKLCRLWIKIHQLHICQSRWRYLQQISDRSSTAQIVHSNRIKSSCKKIKWYFVVIIFMMQSQHHQDCQQSHCSNGVSRRTMSNHHAGFLFHANYQITTLGCFVSHIVTTQSISQSLQAMWL